MSTTTPARSAGRPTSAPLGRLLLSELALTVPRPRTYITLGVLALVPLLVAIGLQSVAGDAAFVLLVQMTSSTEFVAFALATPVVLVAADAFAAERAQRTLDALFLAPVGIGRLLLLKATGVVAAAALSAGLVAVVSLVGGLVLLDLGRFTFWSTIGRELMIALWMTGQLSGIGILLLPLSALLRRPAGVTVAGLVAMTLTPLAGAISPRFNPLVPAGNWYPAVAGLSEVPIDWSGAGWTTLRACVYAVVGGGVTLWLLSRRDG